MPKTKISEFSATPGNNTDIDGINIAEGCAPSGINDAIRELMAQLKDFQAGTAGDSFNGPVGTTTAAAGAFTTLSASSTVSGTGFSTYLASPPAIGGTTAAAGSFTTLSASSSVTLSGGTANGVAYLNGSKVLTTGSALSFDGAGVTIGAAASASTRLTVNGPVQFNASTDTNTYLTLQNTAYLTASGSLVFGANSAEGARLTSTGLGIGTSSPGEKLQVAGAIRATGAVAANTTGGILAYQGSSTVMLGSWGADASTYGAIQFYQANSTGTLGRTAMLLDTSGNLGLGVTPSAWTSGGRALDVSSAGTFAFTGGLGTIVAYNAFHNGTNWIYKASTGAKAFVQDSVNQYWLTAGNGTAGNAISFTQAMTLTQGGNLLVGTTSDLGARLHTAAAAAGSSVNGALIANTSGGTGSGARLLLSGTNSTERAAIIEGVITSAGVNTHDMVFYTNPSANTPVERARITSGGDVVVTGIGGLGYGTGSGGAVTQATSRTTGVTLDKTNGAITLVSAAGTTTWQTFTVTNNKVAATDTVIVNQKSGTDLYQIFVTNVAAGSFKITFATTGGTTTEQPVFNFAVIKAVTA